MRLLAYFCVVSFASALGMSFYSLLLPLFAKQFGAGLFAVGLLSSVSALAFLLAASAFDFLSDLFLKRKSFVFAGLVFTGVFVALNAFASSYEHVLVLTFFTGVATAVSPIFLAMFSETFRNGFRMKFGFFSAASSAGSGLGVLAAGVLAEALGFRSVFLVSGLLVVFCAVLFRAFVSEARYSAAEKKKAPIPKGVYGVYVAAFLRHTCANGLWAVFPIYLQRFSQSLAGVGFLYATNMLLQPLFMIVISKRAERLGRLALFTIGLAGSLFAFLTFAAASEAVHVVLAQALTAFSWACISLGANEYVLEKTAARTHAEAEGFLQSSLSLAAVVGSALGGLLSEAYGFSIMLFVLSGFVAASILLSGLLLRAERREAKQKQTTKREKAYRNV